MIIKLLMIKHARLKENRSLSRFELSQIILEKKCIKLFFTAIMLFQKIYNTAKSNHLTMYFFYIFADKKATTLLDRSCKITHK